eukprot:9500515-Pyramimonas_sp.AAC.1
MSMYMTSIAVNNSFAWPAISPPLSTSPSSLGLSACRLRHLITITTKRTPFTTSAPSLCCLPRSTVVRRGHSPPPTCHVRADRPPVARFIASACSGESALPTLASSERALEAARSVLEESSERAATSEVARFSGPPSYSSRRKTHGTR